ncbi:MAG: DUF3606 domain-containing protein [Pedobacter sp.]|nr:MAG: DUF3606 domain-containing protein [Pedobacter sp.]
MAKSGPKDRKMVNSSQDWEISHVATKMGVSSQAVSGAKRATGSNDRAVIEKYLSDKGSKGKGTGSNSKKDTTKKK